MGTEMRNVRAELLPRATRSAVAIRAVCAGGAALWLAGCGASSGRVKVGASAGATNAEPNQENAWSENGAGSSPPPGAVRSTRAPQPQPQPQPQDGDAPQPAPAAAPQARCPLVCNVANRGRVAAADEARFTAALAAQTEALHACTRGRIPSMTLRFDSQGTLTSFGVAVDDTADGAPEEVCLETAQRQKPAIEFAGPSTVRCAEAARCGR